MEKKELYQLPSIEEVDSRLFCQVAQGASGIIDDPDNSEDI